MRLSLQLYTVRDAMAQDIEGTLAAIRSTGLEYVELAGYYGMTTSDFSSALNRHGFKVSGSHVAIDTLEHNFDQVVVDSRTLGFEWVIVPYIGQDRRDWSENAKLFTRMGDRLAEQGLHFAYHNHDFEFGQDQGLRTLIAESGSSVSFQIDLGWVQVAGEDPAEFMREVGSRARLVHLKDMAPRRENIHVIAGDGAVDWPAVLAACEDSGVLFGSVEMDIPPNDPITDTLHCIRYFQEKGLR